MFEPYDSFSGFSVKDTVKAKDFYANMLGLKVDEDEMGLTLHVSDGQKVFIYESKENNPAECTILNFKVENIDETVSDLEEKGVSFEHYENMHQDEKGIARGLSANMGPDIAWFKDPSGNILSVLQEK